jgi:hypothetical protein
MTETEANEIIMADTLRYMARYRRDTLTLGTYKTPRSSRDNVGAYDGHKPNTYRRTPRTAYTNPVLGEGTATHMEVFLPDGTHHIVPAIPTWRKHVKTNAVAKDVRPDTARIGGSQADYD